MEQPWEESERMDSRTAEKESELIYKAPKTRSTSFISNFGDGTEHHI